MNSYAHVKLSKFSLVVAVALLVICGSQSSQQQQQQQLSTGWGQPVFQPTQQEAVQPSDFSATRQPIAADLQNQVNALSAQIAAANRQLQYFQQQLSLAGQQQQPRQPNDLPQQQAGTEISLGQQLAAQQQQQQHLLVQQQQQQQQQQQLAAQQQQPQFFGASQPNAPAQQVLAQPQPEVSTLVDGAAGELAGADPRYASRLYYQPQALGPQPPTPQQQFAAQIELQQQQQAQQARQQQQQQQATSTTVDPPSLETSLAGQEQSRQVEQAQQQQQQLQQQQQEQQQQQQQQQQPQQLAPPANMAPPHNPPKNDDKFSIGLGVLSPGYTQKFGNTALDFNQDKDGFSFTLSNNGHNNQPPAGQQQQQQPQKESSAASGESQK